MRAFSIISLVACFLSPAQADSWAPPTEFEAHSDNKQFIARITPGQRDSTKPRVVVFAANGGARRERWRATLSNPVAPTQAFISDDGEAVVTLDNWFGSGYGDDVVAIYNRNGQGAKYALEQIVPPPKIKLANGLPEVNGDYDGKISRSTASRHWRQNGFEFMSTESGGNHFCLWLDWANRWVAWRLNDGQLVRPTDGQTKEWNVSARLKALEAAKSKEYSAAALNFLGRLRHPQDRPLIEAWLKLGEFNPGLRHSYSSDRAGAHFAFTSSPYQRSEADRILARWDAGVPEELGPRHREAYYLLGTLEFSAKFPASPGKGDGILHAYLIPESLPLDQWSRSQPEHYLTADLGLMFPMDIRARPMKEGKLESQVNFIIYGITPGNYRVKVVWDKAAPIAKSDQVLVKPSVGDYESVESPIVEIRKGEVTKSVTVDCLKLVTGK